MREWAQRGRDAAIAVRRRMLLPRLGFVAGAAGGALYAAQSARHMIVGGPHDKLVVGLILTLLASGVGWLSGLALSMPQDSEVSTATADEQPSRQ